MKTPRFYSVPSDSRFTVSEEFTGHQKAQFVVRFCGDWVDSRATFGAAVVRAIGECQRRKGALIVEEIPA